MHTHFNQFYNISFLLSEVLLFLKFGGLLHGLEVVWWFGMRGCDKIWRCHGQGSGWRKPLISQPLLGFKLWNVGSAKMIVSRLICSVVIERLAEIGIFQKEVGSGNRYVEG